MNAKLNLLIAGLFTVAAHPELNRANAQVSSTTQTPEYMVIDLGTLGGDESFAYDINESGQVVGKASINNDISHAFLYSNGIMQDLGASGEYSSYARGINDKGQVVGLYGNFFSYAFLYSNGSIQNLGTLGGYYSTAYAINNNGQVVGDSSTFTFYRNHAFLYSNGSMQDLNTFDTHGSNVSYGSRAYGINNIGQVVGWSQGAGGYSDFALLYSNGSVENLGTLGGRQSYAYAINNIGQVAGESEPNYFNRSISHAFLYSNGSMRDLGTLGGTESAAYGINDKGQVVGLSRTGGEFNTIHAFLYSNGSMRDLNDLIDPASKWILKEAKAINNAGQIVGSGTNPAGKRHAFLLNPLPSGWKKVIEKTPPQPTYTAGPEKLPDKDSLVVVTHGWKPDITWVEEMTNSIVQYLQDRGLNNWQVHAHKWVEKANVPLWKVLSGAEEEGENLGKHLTSQKWSHIHLIGHSAGSALIQSATLAIKDTENGSQETVVHTTFLDAYVGAIYQGRKKYGEGANWADNYFSRDTDTVLTDQILLNAYNVEVTWLDSVKKPVTVSYSTPSGDVSQTCYQTVSSHEWPHEFYQRTLSLSWQESRHPLSSTRILSLATIPQF